MFSDKMGNGETACPLFERLARRKEKEGDPLNDQDHLGSIFFQYDLFPERIQSTGKVKKLITNRGAFALKETVMTNKQRLWFVHVLERLSEIGYRNIVPIQPTKYGDHLVVSKGKTYYLMPWLQEDQQSILLKEEVLIEEAANVHALTEKEQAYSDKLLQNSYRSLLERWDAHKIELKQFAQEAENNLHVSPFQLTILSNRSRILEMAEEAKAYLSQWYQICKQNRKIRAVLCHGRLSFGHVLTHNERGCLLNFERTVLDSPARDLAAIFRKTIPLESRHEMSATQLLNTYENHFPLRKEEKYLLAGYLAYPEFVYGAITDYRSHSQERTELEHKQRLEKYIYGLKNLRAFSLKVTGKVLNPSS
jgi:spore coat protein YsxE